MAAVVTLSMLLLAVAGGVAALLVTGAGRRGRGRAGAAAGATLLEILPVTIAAGPIHSLRPRHAASWRLACPPGADPGPVVVEALRARGLRPSVVHSTSWRHQEGRLVLTYLAVLAAPARPAGGLVAVPVRPQPLARGGALTAPTSLDVEQVLQHALRHLAWLQREDPEIAVTLDPAWAEPLAAYAPEPFHARPTELPPAAAPPRPAPAPRPAGAVVTA
ncbi:MAG TPA: hypothetical protein VGP96_06625 [Candidatus Dormibacteraeota bacterium]|jgi:hypothetical protein|nr:hypothetical protein [Candidatus Dormibacteraeota bacterium]